MSRVRETPSESGILALTFVDCRWSVRGRVRDPAKDRDEIRVFVTPFGAVVDILRLLIGTRRIV